MAYVTLLYFFFSCGYIRCDGLISCVKLLFCLPWKTHQSVNQLRWKCHSACQFESFINISVAIAYTETINYQLSFAPSSKAMFNRFIVWGKHRNHISHHSWFRNKHINDFLRICYFWQEFISKLKVARNHV